MTASADLLAAGPRPSAGDTVARIRRAYGFWAAQYRRTWRGSVVSVIISPVAFLAAMGLGLGTLVHGVHTGTSAGAVDYLRFLAPAFLATSAMNAAVDETTYPVLGAIKWQHQYDAMLATPLRAAEICLGHLAFALTRVAISCTAYFGVMLAFGVVDRPEAALGILAGVLVGAAFGAPIMAYSASRENDMAFNGLYRFFVVPLFLFSGTFFPVSQLPGPLQVVAKVTPLWHGVELCRGLSLGTLSATAAAVHVGYLLVLTAVGLPLALRIYRQRLVV
jgi:lipooligosaccharide transport system permease protein